MMTLKDNTYNNPAAICSEFANSIRTMRSLRAQNVQKTPPTAVRNFVTRTHPQKTPPTAVNSQTQFSLRARAEIHGQKMKSEKMKRDDFKS